MRSFQKMTQHTGKHGGTKDMNTAGNFILYVCSGVNGGSNPLPPKLQMNILKLSFENVFWHKILQKDDILTDSKSAY